MGKGDMTGLCPRIALGSKFRFFDIHGNLFFLFVACLGTLGFIGRVPVLLLSDDRGKPGQDPHLKLPLSETQVLSLGV